MLIIDMLQSLFIHAYAVICNINNNPFSQFITMNLEHSLALFVFQTMIDGILHNGLQHQTYDLCMGDPWIHIDLKFQLVLVSHFLNRKIASYILDFLPDGHQFVFNTDTLPEKPCQRSSHKYYLFILLSLCHPDNRIQRII